MQHVGLDSRDHGELVAEARRRLELACPELNVNGGPDAGATLIELFAWMTSLAIERLGRVPDKLHIALLDLLGIQLHGPAAARTGLRMRLSAPATEPLEIRAGTEAGTLRTAAHESIVFTVQEDFTILPLRPAAYVIQRAGTQKEIGVADGVAYPPGPDQLPFSRPPQTGDALYLGIRRQPREPAGQRVDRGLDGPRRRRQARGSAAAVGVQPGGRGMGRGRGDGGPHRWLQLRLGDRRSAVSADMQDRADRRPPPALAALPDRRDDAGHRRARRLHPAAGDLPDHRRAGWGAARRRAFRARDGGAARDQRRLSRPDVRDAVHPGAGARAPGDARGPDPGRRLGAVGGARLVRRLAGPTTAISPSTSSTD